MEAAIGIEPMNAGFAVLRRLFLDVIRSTTQRVSRGFSLLEPGTSQFQLEGYWRMPNCIEQKLILYGG